MTAYDDILTPEVRFHLIRKMERHKVIALTGPALLAHERKYLEFHDLAGVILFERNVQSLAQVSELIASVAECLSASALAPLVVADHEGDLVAELRRIIGVPPAPLAIAAAGDIDLAREVARETGAAMRKLGMNAVLAPVADCFLDAASPITGLRTFGRDPERVAAFVAATVEGFREAGIAACAKHFPGHGSTAEDSHETLPEVQKTLDALRTEDLVPFRAAVEAGVEMVMMSHVAFPMDRGEIVPASFDGRLVGELLRGEMGFGGAVITDALEMAGARWYAHDRFGGLSGGLERPLLAGVDLLLHARPIPEQLHVEGESQPVMSIEVMETIVRTLEKVVDRARIEEKLAETAAGNPALRALLDLLARSYSRVEALRRVLAAPGGTARGGGGRGKVIQLDAYPSVPAVYREVAERAVSGLRGWDDYRPLPANEPLLLVPVFYAPGDSLKRQDLDAFLDGLSRHFPRWQCTPPVLGWITEADGTVRPELERTSPSVVDAARFGGGGSGGGAAEFQPSQYAHIGVVFSSRGEPPEDFVSAMEAFAEAFPLDFVVLTGWPAAEWIPDDVPVLVSLGASPQVAAAVARILAGDATPQGHTQVLFPLGTAGADGPFPD
ncbi:MAG: hypothetical protein OEO21_07255 [Candidatus Krumholzibacteria bacterium]|nr:hypothetical protein [Candidatus Krumholzibacteria bacterium]